MLCTLPVLEPVIPRGQEEFFCDKQTVPIFMKTVIFGDTKPDWIVLGFVQLGNPNISH